MIADNLLIRQDNPHNGLSDMATRAKRAAKTDRLASELNVGKAYRLLDEAAQQPTVAGRIDEISARLIGAPYDANPLGGGPDSSETMTISLERFDCVTYIETVLALAHACSVEEFVEAVRRMRYERGIIDWFHRNHYMIDWAEKNEKRGLIKNITAGPEAVRKSRKLTVVKGLPEERVNFDCIPKRRINRISDEIETGDVILFVSAKKNLDVFHTGFLVRRGGDLFLRHATRSKGEVVEQKLSLFLKSNRMSGIILLRPLGEKRQSNHGKTDRRIGK
ncbi:MAG TPA: N-acetylmuramoyl-L-alanine amidase-like domain-containing protein [Blastocatellia bacterium]|nr:N-acetylmuramoyl-L-alanine amidase-like domain-containing protein [Blastocatellia bacterium]